MSRCRTICAGEQAPGGKPYYMIPIFTDYDARLFVRFIPQYINARRGSPKHRACHAVIQALDRVTEMARDPRYNVYMDLPPGEMQFINNYHVLHGRQAYEDDFKRSQAAPQAAVAGDALSQGTPRTVPAPGPVALEQQYQRQPDQGGGPGELMGVLFVAEFCSEVSSFHGAPTRLRPAGYGAQARRSPRISLEE